MNSYEIITYGGGEILLDIFSTLARLVNSGSYLLTLKLFALLGFTGILVDITLNGRFIRSIRWYLSLLLLHQVILLPRVTVKITDRLESPLRAGALVDDIPLGIGLVAHLVTVMGDGLVQVWERNLILPNDLYYSHHGLLFGSQLLGDVTARRITNARLATNLDSFLRHCVIYGVLQGRYSPDELSRQSNLVNYFTENAHSILAFDYRDDKGIITRPSCRDGLNSLRNDLAMEAKITLESLNKFQGMEDFASLGNIHNYLLGISQNSAQLLEQNLLLNSMLDATDNFLRDNGLDAAAMNFAFIRGELQQKTMATLMLRSMATQLPLLKILLEAILYICFPIMLLLWILLPNWSLPKNYLLTMFYLQLWPLLLAVFHRLLLANLTTAGKSLMASTGNGVNLTNFLALRQLTDRLTTQAGLLVSSLPAIAGFLLRGLEGVIATAQNMVGGTTMSMGSVAADVSSGNLNYGNVAFRNANYSNVAANRAITDHYFSSGKSTMVDGNGLAVTTLADGRKVYDTSAIHHHLTTQVMAVDQQRHLLQHSLLESRTLAAGYASNYQQEMGTIRGKLLDAMQHGRYNFQQQQTISQQNQSSLSKTLQRTAGIGFDARIAKLFPLNAGIKLDGVLAHESRTVREAIRSGVLTVYDEQGHSINSSISQRLEKAQRYADNYHREMSRAKTYQQQQEQIKSSEISFGDNLTDQLMDSILAKYPSWEVKKILTDRKLLRQEFFQQLQDNYINDILPVFDQATGTFHNQ
jgi:conjugal transfer mating pair stabilization protein TraG